MYVKDVLEWNPRRWARLWWKMLGIVVTHQTKYFSFSEFCWSCPSCKVELKTSSEEKILLKIEEHLIEDDKKGIIK